MVERSGSYEQDVAGESFYSENLSEIMGGSNPLMTQAYLFPEPTNKYDPNAIAVVIGTQQVGYIPKKDCPHFLSLIQAHAEIGQWLVVPAMILEGSSGYCGVSLDCSNIPSLGSANPREFEA